MEEISRPPTITNIVAEKITEAIFSGEIGLDQSLREKALMMELAVSRSTVREALLQLQNDGLVTIVPYRGAYVNHLTNRQVLETYTLRAVLEPYAADLAMRRQAFDKEVVKELRGCIREMRKCQLHEDLFCTIAADANFHYTICKASGHELLVDTFEGLLTRTRLCILGVLLAESTVHLDAEDHIDIVTAIEKGDSALLSKNLKRHLTKAVQDYYSWSKEEESDRAESDCANDATLLMDSFDE